MYLLSGLLLTTLIAFCHTQDVSPQCEGQDGTQHSSLECCNITDISALTDPLSSVNLTVVFLKISHSPQLRLQFEDLNLPTLQDLKYVWLVDNNLTSFNSAVFQARHLETFGIIRNNLVSINASTFQGLTTVKKLLLYKNEIATIHNSAFKPFQNLSVLDLSHNKLTAIDADLFEGVALLELSWEHNLLTSIEERSFHGLAKVLNIDLSTNKIKSIDPRAFQTTPKLQLVDLGRNELQSLDGRLFENTNLITLSLAKNDLEAVSNYVFNSTTLVALDLAECNIQSVPSSYFLNLPKLVILHLENNKISHIEDNLFTPLVELRLLSLNRNNLTALSVASFQQFDTILSKEPTALGPDKTPYTRKEVILKSNPWNCEAEEMINLRAWTVGHNIEFDKFFNCAH